MPQPVQEAASKAAGQSVAAQVDPRIVSVEGEADRLWKHVLFGTGTCIGMVEGYCALDMPGDPLPQLYSLVERLVGVIKKLEQRNEARPSTNG